MISESSYFGRIRTSARGVTKAYDQCPLDGRMKRHCDAIGISINGFSRFSTLPDLAGAEVIITLDHESNHFTQKHAEVILGQVRPFGSFLQADPPHMSLIPMKDRTTKMWTRDTMRLFLRLEWVVKIF